MKIIAGTVEKPDLEDNIHGIFGDLGKTITIDMTGSTESSKALGLLCSREEELRKPDDGHGPLIFMVFFILYWAVIVWCMAVTPFSSW